MTSTRRHFVACATALAWFPHAYAGEAPLQARALPDKYPGSPGHEHNIVEPGLYRLDRDIVVRKSLGLTGHSGPNGGIVIQLLCGGVELDLAGHEIAVHHGLSAIALSAKASRELARRFPDKFTGLDSRKVTVRNGTIDLSDDSRGDDGVTLVDAWTDPGVMTLARGEDGAGYAMAPKDPAYQRNEYRLEKLKVLSNGVGVALEGSQNALRDCVVESSGNVAVFSAGPDNLIENCEIRLRPLERSPTSENSPLRGAIVLRDGSNTVIRNCRIRVDKGGLPSRTHCILARDGATNVVVENCTFVNVDEADWITSMEGARVESRGNKSERRW